MPNAIRSSLIFCLGLLAIAPARAIEPGWYLLGFGGEASAQGVSEAEALGQLEELVAFNGLEVVEATVQLDDSDTGYGVAGGYQFNDHFALEFGYVDLGAVAYEFDSTLTDGEETAEADVQLESASDGPVFSALGILPIGERFSVFARVGFSLMNAKGRARVTIDGQTNRAEQSSQKSDPMFGVGAEYSLGRHFAVRLAWDRYMDVGTNDVTGDIDSDLISLGLRMSVDWFR